MEKFRMYASGYSAFVSGHQLLLVWIFVEILHAFILLCVIPHLCVCVYSTPPRNADCVYNVQL